MEAEQWWIAYFISLGFSIANTLYNFTLGGEGTLGRRVSDETKAKLSAKARISNNKPERKEQLRLSGKMSIGRKVSEKTKKKLSALFVGENNPNYGKDHPAYGILKSPEAKAKISAAKQGKNNPNFGRKLTQEQIEQIEQIEHRTAVTKANRAKKKEQQGG